MMMERTAEYTYFTVFLEAFRTLAPAAHVVRCRSYPWFESLRVFGANILHRLVAKILIGRSVVAVYTFAVGAKELCRKTFAVELETLRLFAVAGHALLWSRNICCIFFSLDRLDKRTSEIGTDARCR
jgi:hypothetical protein